MKLRRLELAQRKRHALRAEEEYIRWSRFMAVFIDELSAGLHIFPRRLCTTVTDTGTEIILPPCGEKRKKSCPRMNCMSASDRYRFKRTVQFLLYIYETFFGSQINPVHGNPGDLNGYPGREG